MICTLNRIKLISSTYASVSRKYKRTQSPYSACFWHYLLLTAQTQPVRSGVPGLKTTMDWMKYAILNLLPIYSFKCLDKKVLALCHKDYQNVQFAR